ncbi:thymidylate kinase [Vibrio phage vB_VmeM-Yong XC32]|nr:thymidylate kinase [Vibrio phage vB_VmeM-Yong XC31]QAX96579.1 thymidylate kinase [Vibrio phage vB_VmeM-Yong XC32]QAX96897.1 thymidylate kinase [Vibrio phage vB_VmeM-Yong MS31]QAX97202.1 thymidylate kinase [Vibrio phage vB_VmeM-Yong MS32]
MISKYGRFIVIEGLEGAGKSTAIQAIKDYAISVGISPDDIVCVREPGGTVLAEKLRALVKQEHEGEVLNDRTELLMMYAARVQLVENVIKPALMKGKLVIGDRHDWSTLAYQGAGRGIPDCQLMPIRDVALGGFEPDFYIYMDVDPMLGMERARGRGELDRIEMSGLAFFQRARLKFMDLAAKTDHAAMVDSSGTIEETAEKVKATLHWLSRDFK